MSDDLSLDARVLRFRSDGDAERGPAFARELLEARRPREALEVLSRAVAARPDDPELLRLAARALLADGDPLRAQQTLTRIIRADPQDVDAYLLLADALRARGDEGRADAALAKARSLAEVDAPVTRPTASSTPAPARPSLASEVSAPGPSPQVVPGVVPATTTQVPEESRSTPEATERDELQRDVADLLATAMKTASAHPAAPVGGVREVAIPKTAPVPTSVAPPSVSQPLPPRPKDARGTPAPSIAAPDVPPPAKLAPSAVVPPPAMAAPSAVPPAKAALSAPAQAALSAPTKPSPSAPLAPTATADPPTATEDPPSAPSPRPGPRRSPTLLGFAPPRPPARPASVAPPPNTAPLPAIRPPSVRPPGLGAALPPPVVPPPGRAAQLGEPSSSATGTDDDEDMPTAFMDRESLVNALASHPVVTEEVSQAAAADRAGDVPRAGVDESGSASRAAPSTAQLADTLPEFAVSADAAVVPVVLPKNAALPALGLRSGARTQPEAPAANATDVAADGSSATPSGAGQRAQRKGESGRAAVGGARAGASSAASASGPDEQTSEHVPSDARDHARDEAAPAPPRKRRWGAVLMVAIVLSLAAGAGAHVAGVLPAPWSRAIDAQLDDMRGGARGDSTAVDSPPPTPTPAATTSAGAPLAPEPPADETSALDAFDRTLAGGQIPDGLSTLAEGDAITDANALRVRAEAMLLQLAPWWSDEPGDVSDASRAVVLDAIATTLAAGDTNRADALALRASALRLTAAALDTEALTAARALADEFPDDALAQWTLAEALIAHGDMSDADAVLSRVIAEGPETMRARALVQRAWLAHQRGDATAERQALEEARALAPSWGLVALRQVDLRLDAGDYAPVLDELSAMDAEPTPARTQRQLRAALGLEAYDAAEALFAQLPEPARADPRYAPVVAQFQLMRGEPAEAARLLAELASAEGADPSLIALYADALYEAGRTLEASAQYERAIARDASHPEALIGFSQVLLRAHKHREARANLDRAEASLRGRVRPPATLARLQVVRARVMVAEREMAQAAALLRRTLEISGAPSEGWFYLGEALSGSHSPEARAAYERYLALHPVGPLAARARRAIQ
ncbi:MAG: tetratricopeptide repeat protein [Myxococcales bacterium]|nr:tetratricopeptide repeat protein [Myxococcales bacterium]